MQLFNFCVGWCHISSPSDLNVVKICLCLGISLSFNNIQRRTRTHNLDRTIHAAARTEHLGNNWPGRCVDGRLKLVIEVLDVFGSIASLRSGVVEVSRKRKQ